MLLAAVIVILSWFVVEPIQIPMVVDLKPALAVSLGHFMLGLLCIVTQRNILKQAFGYCLMENGSRNTGTISVESTRTSRNRYRH